MDREGCMGKGADINPILQTAWLDNHAFFRKLILQNIIWVKNLELWYGQFTIPMLK